MTDPFVRIQELEDAITEAGIILAGAELPDGDTPYAVIKQAMRRLGKVMSNHPEVLKRQGI